MTKLSRSLVCAGLLVAASTALASSGAPNVQVNVKQGRTKIFTAITDGSGRFMTAPVEPGVYTFELRVLKTAPPAQYFLILSGAKPVTQAMADKNAVLMMDAQVRTARSVTGQVTARRLRIVPPAATSPAAGQPTTTTSAPAPAATPTAVLSRSQATAVGRTAAPARVAVPARIVTRTRAGTLTPAPAASTTRAVAPATVTRPAVATPTQVSAPARAPARASASAVAPPMRNARPTRAVARASSNAPSQPAPAAATPTSGLVPRPAGDGQKIINGKPHVWTPIAPGSTLGRWVPGRR